MATVCSPGTLVRKYSHSVKYRLIALETDEKLYISIASTADVVGDFTLELKKINEEFMIVRAARAKLSAKDKKVSLQGMDEKGPVQAILGHGKHKQLQIIVDTICGKMIKSYGF